MAVLINWNPGYWKTDNNPGRTGKYPGYLVIKPGFLTVYPYVLKSAQDRGREIRDRTRDFESVARGPRPEGLTGRNTIYDHVI